MKSGMVENPGFRWSRGSDPRLLRLTMDGLLDRTSGSAPPCTKPRQHLRVRQLKFMTRHAAGGVDMDQPGIVSGRSLRARMRARSAHRMTRSGLLATAR